MSKETLEQWFKQRRMVKRRMLEQWRPGLLISREALVEKATVGSRVCQYPDGRRPLLIYFAGDTDLAGATLELLNTYKLANGQPKVRVDEWRPAYEHFNTAVVEVGYNLFTVTGHCEYTEIIRYIEQIEAEGSHVFGIAWDIVDGTFHDNSSDAAHPAGNDSNADRPDESNAGGEAPVLPVE